MLDYQNYYREFTAIAKENNWQPLHSPRNLAAAVLQEAAELNREFQWQSDAQSRALGPEAKARVAGELADVALYLFALCEALGLDLDAAIEAKQAEVRARLVCKSPGN
ncbi:nucleotide pyrophosphohydrolase [Simiduia sp. 21SJ11W-1]|uniref:nucleotide pyrophosphohydrolase n=1 Tax=Simiduia sp. 21SJ11W-1 TaxID=2909669 RepID=UPI0020A16C9A|nr:nucleotide pyrophosphohydrolase [Simiduia sp. 21SJ11W-1]UTA46494.1 nucleotide pyrophosphohydrolase [Simiduia sp. 21SJ11W-1]